MTSRTIAAVAMLTILPIANALAHGGERNAAGGHPNHRTGGGELRFLRPF